MNSPRIIGVAACDWPADLSQTSVLFTPVDTIREVYACYARRDFARLFELLSPGIEISESTVLPWGGRFRGLAGAEDLFSRLHQYAEATPEPLKYIAAGAEVVAIGKFRGKARATGRWFEVDLVHVWTVRHGKVTRCAAYEDTQTMREALGIG